LADIINSGLYDTVGKAFLPAWYK